jgi:NADH:ubiquinone oxidoreductase subunit 6 (subunit J)
LLISSIFVFLSCSILFFILELEFLAIAFCIVYVGGITVMFLFLILTVDVGIENAEGRLSIPDVRVSLLITCFVFYFLWLLLASYDPIMFNIFNEIDIIVLNI